LSGAIFWFSSIQRSIVAIGSLGSIASTSERIAAV